MSEGQALLAILVAAFFPVGMKTVTHYSNVAEERMIFWRVGRAMARITKRLPHWIAAPLWECERCMVLWIGVPAAIGVVYGPIYVSAPIIILTAVGVQRLWEP